MRQRLIFLCLLLLWGVPAQGEQMSITRLLEAAARQPDIAASSLGIKAAEVQLQQARAQHYPKVSAFGSYTSFSSPTNLRPMPPTEVKVAAGDSIPFSEEILSYGLKLEMPLFVKSLYSLADQIKQLQQASRIGHQIKVITRQAAVVSLNASLAYTNALEEAIAARLESLNKTRADLQLAVTSGRTPESELLKVNTTLNDLHQQHNDLRRQTIDVTGQLEQLTGIRLSRAVALHLQRPVSEHPFLSQALQEATVAAGTEALQQERDKYYPSLKLEGVISDNQGEAYNTGRSIARSYSYIGIKLSIPLFDRRLSSAVKQAQVNLQRQQQQLAQLRIDLAVEAANLKQQLPLIEHSNELAQASLDNNRQLLEIARVALRTGRMTTEEYLRFETQVLDAEAALYRSQAERWQVISRQAVLYGVELTGVVQ